MTISSFISIIWVNKLNIYKFKAVKQIIQTLLLAILTTGMLTFLLIHPTEAIEKVKVPYYVFLSGFGICGWLPFIATIIDKKFYRYDD